VGGRGSTTDTAVASTVVLPGTRVSDEDQGGAAPAPRRPGTAPLCRSFARCFGAEILISDAELQAEKIIANAQSKRIDKK